jgi:hypothetical protein
VQRRGLARPSRATHIKQAIRFADRLFHPLTVVGCEAQLFKRDWLTSGQDTHDHVFKPPGRGDRRHAQLNVQGAELLELDLSVLGLALLRDVQITHDLEPGHQRLPKLGRHFNVGLEAAVNTQPDARLELARHRLNVDIGCLHVVGIDDDLVDELDQFVVCSCRLQRRVITAVVIHGRVQVCQKLINGPALGTGAVELAQRLFKLGLGCDPIGKL